MAQCAGLAIRRRFVPLLSPFNTFEFPIVPVSVSTPQPLTLYVYTNVSSSQSFDLSGIAGLVLGFSDDLDSDQRWLLLWLIVSLPFAVLGSFLWLVVKHHTKLYSPADFKDQRHFLLLDRKSEPRFRGFADKFHAQLEEAQSKISALESEKAAQAREAYDDLSENYKRLMQAVDDGYMPSFSTVVNSAAASEVLDEATASAAATVSAASSPALTMSELQQLLEAYPEPDL